MDISSLIFLGWRGVGVTGAAIDGQWLEPEGPTLGLGQREMTHGTGHAFVPPAQRESTVPIMIELLGQPVDGHVAASAIEGGHFAELPRVNVVMAVGASVRSPAKREVFPLGPMAGPAVGPGVTAFESEAGGRVVKRHAAPSVHTVATGTTPCSPSGFGLGSVGIPVAIGASGMDGSQVGSWRLCDRG